MDIELYNGARAFTAQLEIDPETGEIGGDYPLDVLVHKNPIGTCAYILHTKAEVEMWKTRIKQLTATVKSFEANAERAKTALASAMKATGTSAIKSDDGMFKAVLSLERDVSVRIEKEIEIPIEYLRVIPASIEPDKNAIKSALLLGQDVPGAALQRNDRLTIK